MEIIGYCYDKARTDGCKALRADIAPTNRPARKLYGKKGFIYAGNVDPDRGMEGIPEFRPFELNWSCRRPEAKRTTGAKP